MANPQLRLINNATATANQRVDLGLRWEDGTYNGIGGISMVRESSTARSGKLVLSGINSSGDPNEAVTITSTGNLGLGVTPSAWSAGEFTALQIGSGSNGGSIVGDKSYSVLHLVSNAYYSAGSFKYIKTGEAAAQFRVYAYDGSFVWDRAATGTANVNFSWSTIMQLFATGNLSVGASPSDNGYKLDVNGTGRFGGNVNITSTTGNSAFIKLNRFSNTNSSNTFPPTDYGFSTSNGAGKFASPDEVIITGNTEIIEMDRMRKLIAKHMVESVQTSPHVTSFVEADVTNMVVWREKVKQLFEKREGTKLTFTPMFMECIAKVLEQFPYINCSLQGDNIILKKDINIGMATALPSGNLIVPVIKGANQLSIVGLSKAVNNLANAARNNQLKPQDTQGGTFTVTNVGTFGSIMGTPIIPQPQVAILALGAIKKRPVVIETPSGDAILVRHMMYLSMSYDHRIVDGAMGSSFLSAVAKAFEQWDQNRQWFQYV
jgi:hypothetical protein